MKWPVKKLGEHIEIVMGQAPHSDDCNKEREGVVFVKAGEFSYESPLVREWTTNPLKIAQDGDTLICVVGATAGKINRSRFNCAIGRSVAAVRSSSNNLDQNYLHTFLKTKVIDLRNRSQGAAQAVITQKMLQDIELPLPPLAEQQRIAALLDTADRILRLRQQAIAKLDQLAQSVFVEMFGNSQKFENKKLSEVCYLITDGTHFTPTYVDKGVIFLSAKNVTKGTVDWDRVKYVPYTLHKELQQRASPKQGDILLAKNGTTGVAAIVDRDVVFDIYVSLALLRPNDLVDKTFLHAALNSTLTKRQFNSALKGIGVPNLHLVEIRKVTIPVPTINAQKKFVEILGKINKLKASFLKSELLIKNKNSSLQHQSFAVN